MCFRLVFVLTMKNKTIIVRNVKGYDIKVRKLYTYLRFLKNIFVGLTRLLYNFFT